MFLSKIWFVIVCLVCGVSLTAAFVAPRSAARQLETTEAEGLDRAQYAAEQMLKTDAHRWINYVAKLGRDAVLTEALDSATRGAGEARVLHETVRGRLHALVPDTAGIGIEQLVAVDGKGRVVARMGERESDYGDSVAGAEVVTDALRGYMSDDVWGAQDKLLRVAAAPVLAKSRDRVVGAIYVGAETGKRLAEVWKKNLDVDVALMLNGKILSSTMAGALPDAIGDEIERRKDEIETAKRTRAFTLPLGSDQLLAVAAPFAGEARELRAHYVLLDRQVLPSDPFALLASTTSNDLSWGRFPWLRLGGGILVMLLIGLFFQRMEMEWPLARLRRDAQKLGAGDLQKLPDTQHPGKFGGIARDVNAAIERYTHAAPSADGAGRDMNAILGAESRTGNHRTFDLPPLPSTPGLGATPASSFPGSSSGLSFAPLGTPSSGPSLGSPGFAPMGTPTGPGLSLPPPPSGPMVPPSSRGPAPPPPPRPSSSSGLAVLPPPPPPAVRPTDIGSGAFPAAGQPMLGSDAATPAAPFPYPPPSGLRAVPANPAFAREMDDAPTSDMSGDIPTRAVDTEEQHMREVFSEYLATRERCGESTSGLTLDKFRAKLLTNRQQLIDKYNCRTARFSVYVKDGKAAIKATPVRD